MSVPRLSQGDIVLVPFPFTNYFDNKRRPALVLSTSTFNQSGSDVVLVAISSNLSKNSPYEVSVLCTHKDFVQTKLKQSSAIKCGKIFSFSISQIDGRLGTLPSDIMEQVKVVISLLLGVKNRNV